MEATKKYPRHLAWRETLEIHELVAMQSTALMKMKNFIGDIDDNRLQKLYRKGIKQIEKNLHELLEFYHLAPRDKEIDEEETRNMNGSFYVADLLSITKAAISSYAIAVTKAATPVLRKALKSQLVKWIDYHGEVFSYMYDQGKYPAYDLKKLLENDRKNAHKALQMKAK